MRNVIIARYGEIHLKGNNRHYFEKVLLDNIKQQLSFTDVKVEKISGRYLISNYDIAKETSILSNLEKVFGLTSISPAIELETSKEAIDNYIKSIKLFGGFKVDTTRADKTFPVPSNEYSPYLGGLILANNPDTFVDLHTPKTIITVDIRENLYTYISYSKIPGAGGMPVSTSGKGLLLLSGGIDSPVAGYLMAKRGLTINAIYFHSYPYTSEQAKKKVLDLGKTLTAYTGKIRLFVVPFTKIQEAINALCIPEYLITIMRRFMFKIAERVAINNECSCLITGENLAQVASQTVQGITCSNSVLTSLPTFRPLISFDKVEIMRISQKINTFEISNLPYEDCCTVFVPKRPVIKPTVEKAKHEESKIVNAEELIEWAINNIEIIEL